MPFQHGWGGCSVAALSLRVTPSACWILSSATKHRRVCTSSTDHGVVFHTAAITVHISGRCWQWVFKNGGYDSCVEHCIHDSSSDKSLWPIRGWQSVNVTLSISSVYLEPPKQPGTVPGPTPGGKSKNRQTNKPKNNKVKSSSANGKGPWVTDVST